MALTPALEQDAPSGRTAREQVEDLTPDLTPATAKRNVRRGGRSTDEGAGRGGKGVAQRTTGEEQGWRGVAKTVSRGGTQSVGRYGRGPGAPPLAAGAPAPPTRSPRRWPRRSAGREGRAGHDAAGAGITPHVEQMKGPRRDGPGSGAEPATHKAAAAAMVL